MVVRILSPRIQWIVYCSLCPWLLTYVSGQLKCGAGEKMKKLDCGRQHYCKLVTCVQNYAQNITKGRLLRYQNCQSEMYPTCGYSGKYIWTTNCCQIWVKICYVPATSFNPEKDMTNGDETSHASTMTTPEDTFNVTEILDMMEQTVPTGSEMEADVSTEINSVMTSTMKASTFKETFATPAHISNGTEPVDVLEQLELTANKKTKTSNAMIGLYAGLPVGLFLFVVVLAVVCYIFRDKLKTMVGKFRKGHKEGLYQESGTTSEQYTGNDISRTFANQEYAMHGEQESHKSENTPTGVYDLCKSWAEPEQNGSFHHNPIQTEAKSSCSNYRPGYEVLGREKPCNTYDRIGEAADRGRFDPTYNHIHESNVSATDMRQGNKGGTDYDNAFI